MPLAVGFGAFYTWLVTVVGAKAALLIFATGTVVTCTVALLVIVKAAIAAAAAAAVVYLAGLPPALLMALSSLIPANAATSIALVFSADAAVYACKYHLNLVRIMAQG